jgi:membrane protease subunit HflC
MSYRDRDPDPSEKVSLGKLAFRIVLAAVIVGLLVAYSATFQVTEGYQAVVTRFGEPVGDAYEKAGLFWKMPWPIEQAHLIDVRRCLFNTPFTATFTKDQRNVVLLTYVVWRVGDPLLFLQSLGTRTEAERKLESLVAAEKNRQMGRYELAALVSTEAEHIKTEEIEEAIVQNVAVDAAKKFGIIVEQVGIKRIAYPEENMSSVVQNMRREREAESKIYREQGMKEANAILNQARYEREEKIKEGVAEAGRITGEAMKQAAEIIGQAQLLDPEFYAFWRSLRALKTTLGEKATVILRTDQSIFESLTRPPKPPQGVAAQRPVAPPAASNPTLSAVE